MRALVFLLFVITLTGCSGLMMSGGSSAGGSSGGRSEAQMQASKDESLTEQIRRLYARDAVLREAQVNVYTRSGVVRISGSVPTYEAREKAEKLAISTDGVTSVENRITVEFSN
jgi:osmotically-inducible protein OsmY